MQGERKPTVRIRDAIQQICAPAGSRVESGPHKTPPLATSSSSPPQGALIIPSVTLMNQELFGNLAGHSDRAFRCGARRSSHMKERWSRRARGNMIAASRVRVSALSLGVTPSCGFAVPAAAKEPRHDRRRDARGTTGVVCHLCVIFSGSLGLFGFIGVPCVSSTK